MSLFLSSAYSPMMTGGRGFIALSALILGKWKPFRTLAGCLVFGVFDAIQTRLQGVPINGVEIPVQWIQILPYVLTIILLGNLLGALLEASRAMLGSAEDLDRAREASPA